jgi:hypothetical protein
MYAAAINRPSPTTPSQKVPVIPALTGCSPVSWAASSQRDPQQANRAANR